jgi:hypothetical protein
MKVANSKKEKSFNALKFCKVISDLKQKKRRKKRKKKDK